MWIIMIRSHDLLYARCWCSSNSLMHIPSNSKWLLCDKRKINWNMIMAKNAFHLPPPLCALSVHRSFASSLTLLSAIQTKLIFMCWRRQTKPLKPLNCMCSRWYRWAINLTFLVRLILNGDSSFKSFISYWSVHFTLHMTDSSLAFGSINHHNPFEMETFVVHCNREI